MLPSGRNLMIMRKFIFILLPLMDISIIGHCQTSVIGKWKTVDDETNETKSIVDIYKQSNKVFGKIIEITDKNKQDAVCDNCDQDDPRKGQKIIGMMIIKNLIKDGDEWNGGTVLDPENGKVYKCKLWLEDGNLIIRGYIGFSLLGRSQTWLPAK